MRRVLSLLIVMLGCAWGAPAHADTCSVTVNNADFGQVSPISGTDYTLTGSGTLSCTFNTLSLGVLLTPNARACLNLNLGTNSLTAASRQLGNGSNRMPYNLYVNATYAAASVWGGPGVTGATTSFPISLSAGLLTLGGTYTKDFNFYGKIPAGASLAAVSTVANSNTDYTTSFAGAGTMTYALYGLLNDPGTCLGNSASFGFTVKATAINNCTITATPMTFANATILTGSVRSTSTLTVRCVNNNGYQIALNGGAVAGNVAARKMKNIVSAATIDYQLSGTLDGPLWGDGTGGTAMVTGTGTGNSVPVTIYGRVPAQTTPVPGDYKDTVTATIYF